MKSTTRFLPTHQFHIVPLNGLSPDDLKQSAKNCSLDREQLRHNTLLNLLAKSLGAERGFAGYRELYARSILPFMKKHGLNHRVDLLACPVGSEDRVTRLQLSVEQVCGRLFNSDLPLPQRLFTGYNFDYAPRYYNALETFNYWRQREAMGTPQLDGSDFERLENLVNKNRDAIDQISGKRIQDLVVGGFLDFSLYASFNLLGDLLVQPASTPMVVPKLYWPNNCNKSQQLREQKRDIAVASWFRETIESEIDGWVDVIPFNEKLIFLKGSNGGYDFVLPNLRSKPFEHQIYAPYLKRADIPSQMNEEYHFQRWYYFEFDGWREQAEHNSELDFYLGGGVPADHPGTWPILRSSLIQRKIYAPSSAKLGKSKSCPVAFHRIQLDEKCLYVSDLIPIADFARFTNHRPDYIHSRNSVENSGALDDLSTMNRDAPDLPASVTWYDACAFMAYFEELYGLPVRLLKTWEYKLLREQCPGISMPGASSEDIDELTHGSKLRDHPEKTLLGFGDDKRSDNLLTFIDEQSGRDFGPHPEYMSEDRFQSLVCQYAKSLEYIKHPVGLRFVDSDQFGEWLYENPYGKNAAAVRSRSVRSIYNLPYIERDHFIATSTGKYKHMKIGFRICYAASN